MSAFPFSFPVRVNDIDRQGRTYSLEAGEEARAGLAEAFGILGVERLASELRVRETQAGYSVRGPLEAEVVQTCVVTLEPVRQAVNEEIDLLLRPAGDDGRRDSRLAPVGGEDADAPDAFTGGVIDLGAIVSEHLALGLDPYPRAPGIAFSPHEEGGKEPSPFAALARLKDGGA
jgi:uncharacterized metal-binding protein YceD (DUF177 family)